MSTNPTKSATAKYVRGDFVFYKNRTFTISAIVRRVHRDGAYTVEARHALDRDGNISGAYIGYEYRIEGRDLRAVQNVTIATKEEA